MFRDCIIERSTKGWSLWPGAWETVEAGLTSPAEIRRVLGFRHDLTETEIA